MSIEELIRERHSVRKYEDKVVEQEKILTIRKTLEEAKPLFSNVKYRIEVITSPAKVKDMKIGFGGAMRINAPCCLVAITDNTEDSFENVGFIQEQVVLELIHLGLGACWLGTFDRAYVNKECNVKENEIVTDVIAFGYLQKSFYNNGLRKLFGSTKRKPVEEIAFYNKWNTSCSSYLETKGQLKDILYLATLAPSANNVQPIRVILGENEMHIFSIVNKKNDYYRIDAGIFLSHIYLVLKGMGNHVVIGKENIERESFHIPEEVKYIATCRWGN